jgi:DSHCT (NUC185) domain
VKLSTSEVLQMAGRAGRRGKDVVGYSVLMQSPYEGPIEAFRAVTSEVDALQSHFTPSYGMVLNLLQSRSIEDARSLVDRSFGAFLRRKADKAKEELQAAVAASPSGLDTAEASEYVANETAALLAVAAAAENLVAAVEGKQLLSYVSALERVKAERRALRYVVRQSREMDTQIIEDTLAFAPPGTRVTIRAAKSAPGLSKGAYRRRKRRELTTAMGAAGRGEGISELRSYYLDEAEEDDVADSLHDSSDDADGDRGSNAMEGILLDIGPDFGVTILFAAVCEDGQMHFFTHEHVEALDFETEAIDLDSVAPDWRLLDYPERAEWTCIGVDQYVVSLPPDLAPLSGLAAHAAAARRDQSGGERRDVTGASSAALEEKKQRPEVFAQRERLAYAKTLVVAHELHGRPETAVALRARRALAQITAVCREREESDAARSVGKRSKRKGRKRGSDGGATAMSSELAALAAAESAAAETADYGSNIFGEFLSIVQVAKHYGLVDEDNCVTALGEVGAKVRCTNELWATVCLTEPSLETVSPVHLAAVMAAVLSEGMRSDAYVAYQPSPEACALIENLVPMRNRLLAVQDEAGLDVPVGLEMESVGLVEAWASGDSWVDILSNTSLQEGDVCRILRRVLDLLRQVPHLPFVSDGVKLNAKRSVALFDRFPVVDDRTYQVRSNEKAPVPLPEKEKKKN